MSNILDENGLEHLLGKLKVRLDVIGSTIGSDDNNEILNINLTITNDNWVPSSIIEGYPYEKHVKVNGVHSNDDLGHMFLDVQSILIANEAGFFGGADIGDSEIIFYTTSVPSSDITGHLILIVKKS